MNRMLKWKLIVGFVLVFLAGGMTGVYVGASHAHHLFFGPHPRGMFAERMRARLRMQLHLTNEQLVKISPIIDKTATQLEEIRTNTGQRVRETFAQLHREIAADLTPAQRAKLQDIEARYRRWHRAHAPPQSTPEPSPSASAQ